MTGSASSCIPALLPRPSGMPAPGVPVTHPNLPGPLGAWKAEGRGRVTWPSLLTQREHPRWTGQGLSWRPGGVLVSCETLSSPTPQLPTTYLLCKRTKHG